MSKYERHSAIRELLHNAPNGNGRAAGSGISNQEALRRKLALRGFAVTQATLSRDIRELHLMKGPGGYALPNPADDEDAAPSLVDTLGNFGLRVRQAQNQVVVITTMGGAQPVAAAIDHEGMPEVVGTIAGDDTVLVICPDAKYAARLRERLAVWIG